MLAKVQEALRHIMSLWALPGYVAHLEAQVGLLRNRVNELTDVHADIHPYGESIVIVAGRYKDKDYVRVFSTGKETLSSIIERLIWEEKNARVGRFDILPRIDIRAFYDRERF